MDPCVDKVQAAYHMCEAPYNLAVGSTSPDLTLQPPALLKSFMSRRLNRAITAARTSFSSCQPTTSHASSCSSLLILRVPAPHPPSHSINPQAFCYVVSLDSENTTRNKGTGPCHPEFTARWRGISKQAVIRCWGRWWDRIRTGCVLRAVQRNRANRY